MTQTAWKENVEYSHNRSRSYDLLVNSQVALPLHYTKLVEANKENIFKKDWENDCNSAR